MFSAVAAGSGSGLGGPMSSVCSGMSIICGREGGSPRAGAVAYFGGGELRVATPTLFPVRRDVPEGGFIPVGAPSLSAGTMRVAGRLMEVTCCLGLCSLSISGDLRDILGL